MAKRIFTMIFIIGALAFIACCSSGDSNDGNRGCLNCDKRITWSSYGSYKFKKAGDDSTARDLVDDCGWHVYGSHNGGYGDTLQVASCSIEDCPPDTDNPSRSDIINDYCVTATYIDYLPFEGQGDTTVATVDSDDPVFYFSYRQSVWYIFEARQDGYVTVDTSGSDYDTIAAAFTGSCNAYNNIDYDDDGGSGTTSMMVFAVSAGESYYLLIGSYGTSGQGGDLFLSVNFCECLPSEEGVVLVWAYNDFYGFRVREGWTGSTKKGIRIGSTIEEFLRAYPGFRNEVDNIYYYNNGNIEVDATFDNEGRLEELMVGRYFRH